MAEQSAEHLALLYRVTQAFSSTLELDVVLDRVLVEVIAATKAERGFILLRETSGQLNFRAANHREHGHIAEPEKEISHTVVNHVVESGQPTLTHNAQEDANSSESVVMLGLRSVLCVPLQVRGQTFGVIYVDNRWKGGIFTPQALELLTAIANGAASAIENARLYQLAVERGRLERELQVARDVQASFIPNQVPHIAGWDIAAWWQPARAVSGDFYDFVPRPDGSLAVVIADVSDKGMPAALFMALSRTITRASLTSDQPLKNAVSQANRLISADATNGMFVTMACVALAPNAQQVTFVNAGHNPPLVFRPSNPSMTLINRTGILLGLDEDAAFDEHTISIKPDDLIILYTDGVTDATSPDERLFGLERLQNLIIQAQQQPATELVNLVNAEITRFTNNRPPFDDIALVIARRIGG